jgi:AcrR family transcriptional regulator
MVKDRTTLRQDARLRRERLLQAAQELFLTEGPDVPLEKIADRAEVGRGTLYRNFPDRDALWLAVVDARLEGLRGYIRSLGGRKDAFFLGVRAIAHMICATTGFEKMHAPHHHESFASRFRTGVEELLAEPLARAKAAGLVRPDFLLTDVHMATLMVAGGGLENRAANPKKNIERALRILATGLVPRSPEPLAQAAPAAERDKATVSD